MNAAYSTTCRRCGDDVPAGTASCPSCGASRDKDALAEDAWSVWDRVRNTKKKLWVISAVGFWISVGVTLVIFFIQNRLDLILVSIVLGLMCIGVWLKTQYQFHLRKEPPRQATDDGAD